MTTANASTDDTAIDEQAQEAAGGFPFQTGDEWQNFFEKFGANGRTFQDFTQLTPQSMEVIYMAGYNQFNAGKYDEAEKIFQLLSVLNHFEKKYWVALGASRQLQAKYEEAMKAYGYLAIFDLHNPEPPFYSAKCLLAMNRQPEALNALRAAVFNSEGKAPYAALHEEAKGLLELIEKNSAANS